MPRVMCVYFPHWSLQRIWHDQPGLRDRPIAITRPIANKGSKVIACCGRAQRHGVRPGMAHAEALAMLPGLTCVAEDLDADRHALTQLAEWAQRFSPIVGLEDTIAPACLFIDTTGCAACFGGEEALVQKVNEEFRANGWAVVIALADTIGAAWAMARDERRGARDENARPSPLLSHFFELPVAALRLSTATLALLGQLGIERIGQLTALPRDQVAQRFGPEVGLRLDQLSGQVAEVIAPFHPQPDATASWAFDDPIDRHEVVVKVLDLLLERLQAILEKRHLGTRLVECVFELDGAETQRFECSLSRPAQTASYLSPLVRTRLEQIRVQAPIRAMSVRAVVLEPLADEQPSLFDAGEASEAALAHLLDSLVSRLGRDVVTRARFVADPQPELACSFESAVGQAFQPDVGERQTGKPDLHVHRPLRLFQRPIAIQVVALAPHGTPQRFHHARVDHAVAYCQGPERIETGWWRGNDVQRDYYLVETSAGTRWWIFQRLGDGRWFLHGCFD